jgi:nondiscriminating glutamyl-tRNA synthetase
MEEKYMSVRVRFAPSPTGYVHIGGLRTALYNYMFAKKMGGEYILRIEDTDRTRLVDDAIEGIIDCMEWSGVMHGEGPFLEDGEIVQKGDKGPYIQSERLEIYREYVEYLLENDKAYYCFCTKERLDGIRDAAKAEGKLSKYDGYCKINVSLEEGRKRVAAGEPHVIRLKLPENRDITFNDAVRGQITVNTNDVDDQVLMKTDGFPTYHMAVIVDDHLMGITHVIRGEEWLPSTPKHVYMYEAFGWEAPTYVHLPNILNSDKKKLSKRQGDVAVEDFKKKGYLKEGLLNYIALLGWSPEDNSEIMSLDEMIEKFSFERVSKSGGVFDVNKLNWVNAHYIKALSVEELTDMCTPYFVEAGFVAKEELQEKKEWMTKICKVSQEKIDYLAQIKEYVPIFIGDEVHPEDDEAMGMLKLPHVPEMLKALVALIEENGVEEVKGSIKIVGKEAGAKGKELFMPVRAAVSGQLHGPDLIEIINILGKELVLKRINYVIDNHC